MKYNNRPSFLITYNSIKDPPTHSKTTKMLNCYYQRYSCNRKAIPLKPSNQGRPH